MGTSLFYYYLRIMTWNGQQISASGEVQTMDYKEAADAVQKHHRTYGTILSMYLQEQMLQTVAYSYPLKLKEAEYAIAIQ